MLKPLLLSVLSIFLIFLSGCDPKCEDNPGIPASLNVSEAVSGMEVLIRTDPAELFHQTRNVYATSDAGEPILLEKKPIAGMGVKVSLPKNETGNIQLLADDPDCTGLVPLSNLPTFEESHFSNNPGFITPILPTLVFPSLPSAPIIDITNAWISPQNRSYCLWFGDFERSYLSEPDGTATDGDTNTIEIDTIFVDTEEPKFLDERSVELAIGCSGSDPNQTLFHKNPVSGVVDFKNNFINIFIDRTADPRVGKIEEYVGYFVEPEDVPNDLFLMGGACQSDNKRRGKLMVLTSQSNGHQMLLFKNAL